MFGHVKSQLMKNAKKNMEMKIYGRHACLALFKNRPNDLIRLYVTQEGVFEYKPLIRHCVDHKLAYHIVSNEELDNITKSTHHEGIALIAKSKKAPSLKELLSVKKRSLIVALETVENPHNLGAIMRSSAHFGVSGIIYEAKVPVALSAAAQRTAEGGAEALGAIHISEWASVLDEAKKMGFKIFATSGNRGESLFKTKFPEKTILFFGAEGPGLSEKIFKKMDGIISIPGTGSVESLNVSNATAVILAEWYRQGE